MMDTFLALLTVLLAIFAALVALGRIHFHSRSDEPVHRYRKKTRWD